MAAVETVTADGTLDVFPLEYEDNTELEDCDDLSGFPCWPWVKTEQKTC